MIDAPDPAAPRPKAADPNPAAPENDANIPKIAPSIGRETNRFLKHIDSLAETLPLAMMAIQGAQRGATTALDEFEREFCSVTKTPKKKVVTMPAERFGRYQKLADRVEKPQLAGRLIPRSFVVSLVSQYDAFIGALIRTLYYLRPELINSSDRTLTLSDLMRFGSVDSAREFLIEKEIETVLRKSHTEQFDWLETKFGVPLRKDLGVWPVFIELTERRNLFVHASGVVSQQYLDVCARNKSKVPASATPGKQLGASATYFRTAHEAILEIGVKLAQVLWRKLTPNDRSAADSNLNNLTFNLISEERYNLAQILLDFATETIKKYGSDESRRIFVVNRAQTYKWLGDEAKSKSIITAEDWSAASDKFKLAVAVLLDDYEEAIDWMKKIGPKGEPAESDYREWPLFKKFRTSSTFMEGFQRVFNKPFDDVVEAPDASSRSNTGDDQTEA